MITDLDRSEPVTGGRPAWPLPLVTALCVLAFIGVATATMPSATDTVGTIAPTPAGQGAPATTWSRVEVPLDQRPEVAAPRTPAVPPSTSLGLPPVAYKTVTRVVNSVTTGLYPADEEVLTQLRYRLADDRVAVLVRLPRSDPLRGVEPASYTASSLVVRGIEVRVLTGRTAVEPTILLWSEGTRAYQLYSSVHSIAELVQLAEQLR